jgi:quercetin dioxygenase-like cupin family protein
MCIIKRFDQPDDTLTFDKGKFELLQLGPMQVGRASYEPGWKWTEHVAPTVGTDLCEVEHVGMVVTGQAAVKMRDGSEIVLKPGELFYVPPGHDSWVVGDQPYVSLHFLGSDKYAKK